MYRLMYLMSLLLHAAGLPSAYVAWLGFFGICGAGAAWSSDGMRSFARCVRLNQVP